jgi:(2Fe-2S) ferredoxin
MLMSRFQRHIFVCTNERQPGHPKGCCLEKGSADVRVLFKAELKKRGLSSAVRTNIAGCLDACEFGVSMVIYPDGIWYGGVKKEDVIEIIERTIVRGEVIDRLLIPDRRYLPDAQVYPPLNANTSSDGQQ